MASLVAMSWAVRGCVSWCLNHPTIHLVCQVYCCPSENCRVSPAFFSLSALFSEGAFHNSSPFKGIKTLSKNSRVYVSPAASANSALSATSALIPILCFDFQLSTFDFQLSTSPTSERALSFRRTPECATLEDCAARRGTRRVPCSGTYARPSPIARHRRPPQRGQVHALQPLDRHPPLHRHQRAWHHPRPDLRQGGVARPGAGNPRYPRHRPRPPRSHSPRTSPPHTSPHQHST